MDCVLLVLQLSYKLTHTVFLSLKELASVAPRVGLLFPKHLEKTLLNPTPKGAVMDWFLVTNLFPIFNQESDQSF